MAGAGVKLFKQADILTAADVNVYLMDQACAVFANEDARDHAFGDLNEPTLSEGRICYLADTNLIQFYDGATWIDSSQFSIGDGSVTSAKILNGAILNIDINSSAAIGLEKLADVTIDTKTENYTLVLADKTKVIETNVADPNTVTVPTDISENFPIGSQISIVQRGEGKTQVIPVSGTVVIRKTPGDYLRAQYSSATLVKRAANEWYLLGDLSAT